MESMMLTAEQVEEATKHYENVPGKSCGNCGHRYGGVCSNCEGENYGTPTEVSGRFCCDNWMNYFSLNQLENDLGNDFLYKWLPLWESRATAYDLGGRDPREVILEMVKEMVD